MKYLTHCLLAAMCATALGNQPLCAQTISVTDGTGNGFGDIGGVAIDFNADAAAADWTADLVPGQGYFVDSLTLFKRSNGTLDEDLYMGVYRTYRETFLDTEGNNGQLFNFVGASNNTVNFSSVADGGALTWNFSGINVVAGSTAGNGLQPDPLGRGPFEDDGILFFALQRDPNAMTTMIDFATENGSEVVGIQRIDGSSGAVNTHLAAILQPSNNGDNGALSETFKWDRVPEYQATVTPTPEPTCLSLLGLGLVVVQCKRRR